MRSRSVAGTLLHRIGGCARLEVNSAHHQAAGAIGPGVVVSGRAPDGVIEAIEAPARRFCLGVQWHPEYRISAADDALFAALIEASRGSMAARGAPERVAKRIARSGFCSRRDAERLIAAGRVAVDGEVLSSPAVTVTDANLVTIDGEPLPEAEQARLFRYHKPAGVLTAARDPEGRPTIYDRLPEGPAAADADRPAGHGLGRPAAADQRRRAEAPARAAGDRLAAPLPRARARPDRGEQARGAEERHRDRRLPVWRRSRPRSIGCRAATPG